MVAVERCPLPQLARLWRRTPISRSLERPVPTASRANDGSNRYRYENIGPPDIGEDSASPVAEHYPSGLANQFSGELAWVQVEIEDDDVSHLEAPEATYHQILARQ